MFHFEQSLKCRCHHLLREDYSESYSLPRVSKFFIPEAKSDFPPDRFIDVEHIKLEIEVDLPSKTLKGVCTNEFRVVSPEVKKLRFDAIDIKVSAVFDAEKNALSFEQTDSQVWVHLKQPLKSGTSSKVHLQYAVTEPRAGLYFIAPDADYPQRPWQLWTQGQDQDNRYWIPCHDYPNEKASTEMVVTVDEKFTAISNGRLVESKHDPKTKKKTFHWKQSIPHASYLITLCIGEFVEMAEKWKNSKGDEIPVQYFTLKGREEETKVSFGNTSRMLDFFSKKIGVDYPYEKYAQVVAWDFIYGGMENTSSTTQTEYTLHPKELDLDYSSDPLVAHELAHQWFGDLLTCKEWAHGWLNEGFATYFESLWMESAYGRDEFLYEVFTNEKIYKSEDGSSYRRPIVTNVYMSPSDLFDRHLYEKGARVLHMLKDLVGDELWWKAIHRYVTANYGKTVETVDLQRAFEETTGRTLTWFFEQWVFKAGHPEIKGGYEWSEEHKSVKIKLTQAQKENDLTGIFRLPLRLKVVTSKGEQTHAFDFNEKEATFWFKSEEKPKFVSLNPENITLGAWDFSPGREVLIEQLKSDSDIMGRVFAARALAKDHSRAVVEALGAALSCEKFWGVQAEISEALGQIPSPRAQEFLVQNWKKLSHPKARRTALRAIGLSQNATAAKCAEEALKEDKSPLVQYEAGVALGRSQTKDIYPKILSYLEKPVESWHDYYQRGLLQGLSFQKNEERVMGVLKEYAKAGKPIFLRRDAVLAMGEYGKMHPNHVVDTLIQFTRDSNFFIRLHAIDVLENLGLQQAAPALKRVYDSIVEPRTKRAALLAMKAVREGHTSHAEAEKLKTDFDKLREQYKELLGRVEKLECKTTT